MLVDFCRSGSSWMHVIQTHFYVLAIEKRHIKNQQVEWEIRNV